MKKIVVFALGICCSFFASFSLSAESISRKPVERTFSLIKPEAVQGNKIGHIIARIETEGLHVTAMKMISLTKEEAEKFYLVHKESPFYQELVDYISSGPTIALVIEGENAVENYRKLMGATDPRKAAPGTLRGDFGMNIQKNAVHGSDSKANAQSEIDFFFAQEQIYSRTK